MKILETKTKKHLICIDDFAFSEKYPNHGFAVEFKDSNNKIYKYDVVNIKKYKFSFEKNKEYFLSFSFEEKHSLGLFLYYRIYDIKEV